MPAWRCPHGSSAPTVPMMCAPAISDRSPTSAGMQSVRSVRLGWMHPALLAPIAANESASGRWPGQPPIAYPMIEAYRPKFLRGALSLPADEQLSGPRALFARSSRSPEAGNRVPEKTRRWLSQSRGCRRILLPLESQPVAPLDGPPPVALFVSRYIIKRAAWSRRVSSRRA